MPLNCENKVDTKVCMQKLKKKKKVRKRERERALKSICVSDAMLNASCTIIFSMFKMDLFQCVCVGAVCTSKQKLKQNEILLKVENLKEWKRWRHKCWHQQCKWQSNMNVKYEYRAGRQNKRRWHKKRYVCRKFNNIDNMENAKAIFASILMIDFSVDFSNNFHVCY